MFQDKEYLSALLRTALPIAIQNFIGSSLNAVGVLLVGQLGETSVAAVGLANQIFFLLNLMLFGICSGSAIFTAQFWGTRDIPSIRKVLGLCLGLAIAAGLLFSVIALVFPAQTLHLYTSDAGVIELGSRYLRIVGLSYLTTAITFAYATQLRSTGIVQPPMMVSVVALSFGALLNYVLIFGKLGFPAMGVEGAAWGTCIARLFEFVAMLGMTYLGKFPTAARFSELTGASRDFMRRYFVTVLPVFLNETIWSLGITIYNGIYARISTEALAAINIIGTIEGLAFVVFIGIANASAILIGNKIGAGEEARAMVYARRALILGVAGAFVVGGIMIVSADAILSLYKVSEVVRQYARNILTVVAVVLWVKVSNMNLVVGILRAGGDTRFSLFLDTGTLWLIGIPMALLGAFVLHLPVYWVVVMAASDEITKAAIGLYRFASRKWINNLTRSMA